LRIGVLTLALALIALPLFGGPQTQSANTGSDGVRFAIIGDYGSGSEAERAVASLLKSWNPDFIISTGDNNYPNGSVSTIDRNIGQYYHDFIYPYKGIYGAGASTNRFFPALGNHDWDSGGGIVSQILCALLGWLTWLVQPFGMHTAFCNHSDFPAGYVDYFTFPGNERYYDFTWGPVQLFALDSDPREPDGVSSTSVQAQWLQSSLASSRAPLKLVYMHHPPFSSGPHGSSAWMQWPYRAWGADVVVAGHDHTYERIIQNGFPYFVDGLGGESRYVFKESVAGSEVRYNADFGVMLVDVNNGKAIFKFTTRTGEVIDSYTVNLH
jgi:hypothetical protein